ncbi:MAG: hypothetical protein A4E69_02942 [Syntrophus sp. PtaB.Bin138]|nr:MAG: hypothetical protein A4E69_02942 [Syntrophus sp. PtaB.Bin138]
MSRNRPPFRLESAADVNALYGQSLEMRHRWLVLYAHENVPVKPQALALLPERIDLVLQDVKKRFRRVVQEMELSGGIPELVTFVDGLKASFGEALAGAPEDYYDMVSRLSGEWRGSSFSKESAPPGNPAAAALFSDRLGESMELQRRMAELLRVVLNTGNRQARWMLVVFLMRLAAYGPKTLKLDADLVHCVASGAGNSTALLQGLHVLFVERLGRLKGSLFDIRFHKLKDTAVHRVNRCGVPFPFKTKVVGILGAVRTTPDASAARERLERLIRLSEGRIPAGEMQRVKDIVAMYLNKVTAFEAFFAEAFHTEKIRRIYDTFCRPFEIQEITDREITHQLVLHLYPTKDYHDFLKGVPSGDCSAEVPLAARHMDSPRFFNVRIFHGSKWIGNIYMLDYLDRDALIVDRIQIGENKDLMPLHFFRRFMSRMLESLKVRPSIRILGPSAISNFKWVQQNYEEYRGGRRRVEFKLDNCDSAFDSSRQKRFYLLS